ncbi:hypothetical protein D791_03322 [Nitrincola nitratireducens]|uniref:Uncharacterized protein n=1 Tax=Nitrincola nitratireducens TaxID=1229521 RepID=W9VG49_9GAMM|nr:hypothetical protein D791_03322 [Nitrincola nitratireducens]
MEYITKKIRSLHRQKGLLQAPHDDFQVELFI